MTRTDNRKVISVSCKPEFFDAVRRYCKSIDVPFTVWVRGLIKDALRKEGFDV